MLVFAYALASSSGQNGRPCDDICCAATERAKSRDGSFTLCSHESGPLVYADSHGRPHLFARRPTRASQKPTPIRRDFKASCRDSFATVVPSASLRLAFQRVSPCGQVRHLQAFWSLVPGFPSGSREGSTTLCEEQMLDGTRVAWSTVQHADSGRASAARFRNDNGATRILFLSWRYSTRSTPLSSLLLHPGIRLCPSCIITKTLQAKPQHHTGYSQLSDISPDSMSHLSP